MRRREFITLLGAATAWPLTARAQQPAMPVVGFLDSPSSIPNTDYVVAFRQGLAEAGYVEGQNVAIEYRRANTQIAQRTALAELVSRPVAVIVVGGRGVLGAVLAAKAATSTIPIVFGSALDPVKYGLVASLNRPAGNVTGVTFMQGELLGKRLDLLHQLVPEARTVAFLSSDSTSLSYEEQSSEILAAAQALRLQVIILEIPRVGEPSSDRDYEAAFTTLVQRGATALIVGSFPSILINANRILALAAHHKIPTIYPARGFVTVGGLMSYGADTLHPYRQLAIDYVKRILDGAKPADLPVERSTRFQLAINLKTAKALGLDVPPTLLAIADEVID